MGGRGAGRGAGGGGGGGVRGGGGGGGLTPAEKWKANVARSEKAKAAANKAAIEKFRKMSPKERKAERARLRKIFG